MNQAGIPSQNGKFIRVKFLTKATLYTGATEWKKRLPHGTDQWGSCHFIFDPDERDYDWLVVYEDLPPSHEEELLACPPSQTILTTTEPSSIKRYGKTYTSQFEHVITSQEPWAIDHPGVIRSQAGLIWCYAFDERGAIDHLNVNLPVDKEHDISTICSSKQGLLTPYNRRFNFTHKLIKILPEIERFGRGVREIDQKADAIAPYRYHLAIENHIAPHHITEKLFDPFLGLTLPIYAGAPNVFDYFPEESLIPINLSSPQQAADIIRKLIRDKAWEKRIPAIKEARRLVLEEYHVFALINKIVSKHIPADTGNPSQYTIESRHHLRSRSSKVKLESITEKTYAKIRTCWEQVIKPASLRT